MHYFLSPHYDDAVYSCGALIYQLAQSGKPVTILTVMASAPPENLPQTPVIRDNHTRWEIGDTDPVTLRRAEDIAAAQLLGAKTHYLDIADCIYRMSDDVALYPDEDSLWQPPHPDDPAIHQLRDLTLADAEVIYAPLAIGQHVDHQLVRDRARQLAADGQTVYFYEDFPYMRDADAITKGLEQFGAELVPIEKPFDETALVQKATAMATYRSQIRSFWQNEAEILDDVRSTFARQQTTGGIERLWQQQS